jgi:hypothetical protein
MRVIEIERNAHGPRVRALGQRVHHGAIGCLLTLNGRTRPVGIALVLHDLHDARVWFAPGSQR